MASILVYIEMDSERPAQASLEALGEGRRIATGLGASLSACVPLPSAAFDSPGRQESLARALGKAGTDRVVLLSTPAGAGPAGWLRHGEALHAACDECVPMLVLLAATCAGRDIAPRLAARLSATFMSQPRFEHSTSGQVTLRRLLADHQVQRLSLEDADRPVVATVTPGWSARARGQDRAEVVFLDPPLGEPTGMTYLGSDEDPGARLETARIIVVAGGGVGSEAEYELIGKLAHALGAELGATQTLCARGLAPADRAIGMGLRHVAPALYVACAASGSTEHLGALGSETAILAINTDPHAPIFHVASYGIVGEVATVVPDLIAALTARAALARQP